MGPALGVALAAGAAAQTPKTFEGTRGFEELLRDGAAAEGAREKHKLMLFA